MKVAITSQRNTLDSNIDKRFGRCAYFVIYDTQSKSIEFLPNSNKDLEDGVGPASVHLIASKGVNKIISGEFGLKTKPLLDSLKIQMIVIKENSKKISDILKILNNNN